LLSVMACAGAILASQCQHCAAGYYTLRNHTPTQAHDVVCRACAAGKFTDAVDLPQCKDCAAGTFSKSGMTACITCMPNSFSAAGSALCSCNAGFYPVMTANSTENGTCVEQCAAGSYGEFTADRSFYICSPCPPFTTSLPGSKNVSECICIPEYTAAGPEEGLACIPCERGYQKDTNGSSNCTYVYSAVSYETVQIISASITAMSITSISAAVAISVVETVILATVSSVASSTAATSGSGSGPATMALIYSVQRAALVGKTGGKSKASHAMAQFSDELKWAQLDLPFRLWPPAISNSCVNNETWIDIDGDTCETWNSQASWCSDLTDPPANYSSIDGLDASTQCCVCKDISRLAISTPEWRRKKSSGSKGSANKQSEVQFSNNTHVDCGWEGNNEVVQQMTICACSLILVFLFRNLLCFTLVKCFPKKIQEAPEALLFPQWEGPVLLSQIIAIAVCVCMFWHIEGISHYTKSAKFAHVLHHKLYEFSSIFMMSHPSTR